MELLKISLDPGPLPHKPGEDRRAASRLALLVQIAGLLGTAWVIFVTRLIPVAHRLSWPRLIGQALAYSAIAWCCSAGITFLLYLMIPPEDTSHVGWDTVRTSSAAVWFAPAIMLLSRPSVPGLTAALVLVVSATRLLYTQWIKLYPEPVAPSLAPALAGIFDDPSLEPRRFPREVAPALAIACLLQAGVVGMIIRDRVFSEALLVAGAALGTINAISTGAWSEDRLPRPPRSILGVALTVLLAAALTVGGMRHLLRHRAGGEGGEGGDEASSVSAAPAPRQTPFGTGPYDAAPPHPPAGGLGDGSFPGVILWPEIQPVTRIVAPMPAGGGFAGPAVRPYSIPFGGEYWMYRWLASKPPPNSFFQRGSPSVMSFSTTDHWPLQMEARQKLDQPIDFQCCSKVRVEIWNADLHPHTVSLELLAVDSESRPELSDSFGLAPVESEPDLKKDPVTAVPETLEFRVPAKLSVRMCAELKVVFRRARARADRSARIAIDRFILIPHGL